MNVFQALNEWYTEDSRRWQRWGLIERDHFGDPTGACLVGGLYLFKDESLLGSFFGIRRFHQTRKERKVLKQAIYEVTGYKTHIIALWNDKYAENRYEIHTVLKRAAEIWNETYPELPKAEQPLQVAPFHIDFSQMNNESPKKTVTAELLRRD